MKDSKTGFKASGCLDSTIAYERYANDFLRARDESLSESNIIRAWVHTLPEYADVIEIACGSGFPVSQTLVQSGVNLWAIDSSETLTNEFRLRLPGTPLKCERLQDSDFFAKKFDAAVSIGLVFLLPEDEQIKYIEKVAQLLRPNGRFLFSAPVETGGWRDCIAGIECLSLGYEKYVSVLQNAGFNLQNTFQDTGENHYYDAMIC